ncbi:hypothetical protein AMTRI_Chr02g258010 [Amborella trichopoda]
MDLQSPQRVFVLMLLLIVTSTSFFKVSSATKITGLRQNLIHRDSLSSPFYTPNLTDHDRMRQAARRSIACHSALIIDNDYLIKVGIGNTKRDFFLLIDTGSDLVWIECEQGESGSNSTDPIYDPATSSSYQSIACNETLCKNMNSSCTTDCFYERNIDTRITNGQVVLAIGKIGFGCSIHDSNPGVIGSALVGFGGGPLSLVSQLSPYLPKRFTYCLRTSGAGVMLMGNCADIKTPGMKSTPIYHLLNLEDISVGSKRIGIPPGIFRSKSRENKEVGHQLRVDPNNLFMKMDSELVCLMMRSTDSFSVFSNLMQRNMEVEYDLVNERLSFAPADCTKI